MRLRLRTVIEADDGSDDGEKALGDGQNAFTTAIFAILDLYAIERDAEGAAEIENGPPKLDGSRGRIFIGGRKVVLVREIANRLEVLFAGAIHCRVLFARYVASGLGNRRGLVPNANVHSDVGLVRRVRRADFFGSQGSVAVAARQRYSSHKILSETTPRNSVFSRRIVTLHEELEAV